MAADKNRAERAAEALEALAGEAGGRGEPVVDEDDRPEKGPLLSPEGVGAPGRGYKVVTPRRLAEPGRISIRRTVIPILLTTGLAMLLLGCWAVLVLVFDYDALRDAVTARRRSLARLMLLAWPTGLILLAGAWALMLEVVRWYKGAGRAEGLGGD